MVCSILVTLNWISGLIRLNVDKGLWDSVVEKVEKGDYNLLSIDEKHLLESHTHELYHFMQISTCGYLFRFVGRLLRVVSDIVPDNFHSLSQIKEEIDEKHILSILNSFSELHTSGPEGITILSIIESDAYQFQKESLVPELDLQTYQRIIDKECVNEEYRYAHDYCINKLGVPGFYWFHYISNVSLCTDSPAETFVILVNHLDKYLGEKKKKKLDIDVIFNVVEDCISSNILSGAIGGSIDVEERDKIYHPAYSPVLRMINDACYESESEEDYFSLSRYFYNPVRYKSFLNNYFEVPIIFNRTNDKKRPIMFFPTIALLNEKEKVEYENMIQQRLLLGAVTHIVMEVVFQNHSNTFTQSKRYVVDREKAICKWIKMKRSDGQCDNCGFPISQNNSFLVAGPKYMIGTPPLTRIINLGDYLVCKRCYKQQYWPESTEKYA